MAHRIGVMGGTFDPIHHGHLVAASEVADTFALDEVIFVPTGKPWQKSKKAVSPAEDRYLMTVIATASNPRFSVSRVDIDRDGPTYTVDTLRDLHALYGNGAQRKRKSKAAAVSGAALGASALVTPALVASASGGSARKAPARKAPARRASAPRGDKADFFFITGADALAKILSWKDVDEMFKLAHFIGVTRPGFQLSDAHLPASAAENVSLVSIPAMAISSTDCRNRVAEGKPIWYLVPDGVVQYITKHHLYRQPGAARM